MGRRADKRSFTQGVSRSSGGRHGGSGRTSRLSPARVAALQALTSLREREAFAQEVMVRYVDEAPLSPEDRAFATRLVLGVVSTRGVLDDVLNRCMRTPHDVTDDVRDALQVSAYEIIFLDKSPHAAVDQGVELVRSIAPRAGGVANAVLRKVVASKSRFPFGDPSTDIAAYARLHGFPVWLAEKLIADLGAEDAHALMTASNEPAPVFVAINAALASEDEVVSVLRDAHGEPEPVSVCGVEVKGCYRINSGHVLLDGRIKRLISLGHLLVSDAASQRVASIVLEDGLPKSLLEIGAGRATKTILVQSDAVRDHSSQIERYVTVDNHRFKSDLLLERAERYGVNVARAITCDATRMEDELGEELFDVVFIDAPCTGLGTLRRHPEIRWRLTDQAVAEHAELNARLLKSAARCVAPGGTLVYATCTVTPEENARVVAGFLKSEAGASFSLEPIGGSSAFASKLVSGGCDAHFCAKMRRAAR